jgi:hypothetical protein
VEVGVVLEEVILPALVSASRGFKGEVALRCRTMILDLVE